MARWILKTGLAVAVLAGLAGAGFVARNSVAAEAGAQDSARPAQPVRVTQVSLVAPSGAESFTGTLRPHHEAVLGFRLAGLMIERSVDVGDKVTKGMTMARLDDTDARLQLETAEAELAAARVDLVRARADLVRSTQLFAEGHLAKASLDLVTTAAAQAQSRSDRAERAHRLASNALGYMTLRAAEDGIVTAVRAEQGEVVAAGQPVVSIAKAGAMDVVFALPEQRRDLLMTARATATLWGDANQDYGLTLRDVSPDVDPVGRTYRVRMTLSSPDAKAALGRTATVKLVFETGSPVAVLPLAGVLNDGQGAAVWRLDGPEKVARVPVEIVSADGQTARVRGLQEGDQIVSLGASKIDPNRPVRVVETTAGPES